MLCADNKQRQALLTYNVPHLVGLIGNMLLRCPTTAIPGGKDRPEHLGHGPKNLTEQIFAHTAQAVFAKNQPLCVLLGAYCFQECSLGRHSSQAPAPCFLHG